MCEASYAIDLTAEQMRSRTQILTSKQEKSLKLKNSFLRNQVARIIDGDEELKLSRTSPEIKIKEMNEKLRSTLTDQQIN